MKTERQELEAARAAKEKAKEVLRDVEGISGIGITREDGVLAVRVNLASEPRSRAALPSFIDGVPVSVKVAGVIRKQSEPET